MSFLAKHGVEPPQKTAEQLAEENQEIEDLPHQAANAIDNPKGGRGAEAAAIEQKALTAGHPYQPANGVFQQGRRHDQDTNTPEGRWDQWRAT